MSTIKSPKYMSPMNNHINNNVRELSTIDSGYANKPSTTISVRRFNGSSNNNRISSASNGRINPGLTGAVSTDTYATQKSDVLSPKVKKLEPTDKRNLLSLKLQPKDINKRILNTNNLHVSREPADKKETICTGGISLNDEIKLQNEDNKNEKGQKDKFEGISLRKFSSEFRRLSQEDFRFNQGDFGDFENILQSNKSFKDSLDSKVEPLANIENKLIGKSNHEINKEKQTKLAAQDFRVDGIGLNRNLLSTQYPNSQTANINFEFINNLHVKFPQKIINEF